MAWGGWFSDDLSVYVHLHVPGDVDSLGVGDFDAWKIVDNAGNVYGDPDDLIDVGDGDYFVNFAPDPGRVYLVRIDDATYFPDGASTVVMVSDKTFDELSNDASIADAVWEEAIASHVSAGSFGGFVQSLATAAALAIVDGIVDDILVDTGTTLDGKINTIDGIVDDILADTGTDIPARFDTLDAGQGTINSNVLIVAAQTTADAIADAVWQALVADYSEDAGSFGEVVGTFLSEMYGLIALERDTVVAGSTSTEIRTGLTDANNYWNGMTLAVQDASGRFLLRRIVSYALTNGAFTIEPALPFTPSGGEVVYVVPPPERTDAAIQTIAQAALTAQGYTSARAPNLDNADVATSTRASAADLATVDGIVDSILEDTGTTIPATLATLATQSSVNTIDGIVDSILDDTANALPAQITSEIDDVQADIAALDSVVDAGFAAVPAQVQSAMDAQGYTTVRAALLDNLDVAVSTRASAAALAALQADVTAILADTDSTIPGLISAATAAILADIAALNDLDQAGVQAAMTAQGYTTARAALLDNLDAAVSSVLTAVASVATDAETSRKILGNRVEINSTDVEVVVFDDDGSTPFLAFSISSDGRERTPI